MNISPMLSAINSGDGIKQAIGIQLLSKSSDMQAGLTGTMLQDFAVAQAKVTAASVTPHLGANLDIRV